MSIYKISKIDNDNDSDEYWQRIYDDVKKSYEMREVEFIEEPLSKFKSSYLLWLNNGAVSYFVWKNDKLAGYFNFDIFHKEDAEKRRVVFFNRLFKAYVDEELWKEIFKRFLEYDLPSQHFYIKSENGEDDFITSILGVD